MIHKVLFVSHKPSSCGIYQFGLRISNALSESKQYNFVYVECANRQEYLDAETEHQPVARIINYHPVTMPWITKLAWPSIDIMHEGYQAIADKATNELFDFHISPDPTLVLRNPIVFKTGRLVDEYNNKYPNPEIPVIGSFGFGVGGKNFERIISEVERSFNYATIRLNIPPATFGDSNGSASRMIADRCKEMITKPGITLEIGNSYLDETKLLDFLAKNSINSFLYENLPRRGISSVIDYALAVNRPIAITKSSMFRHIAMPSIEIENSSLAEILKRGSANLRPFVENWTKDKLVSDYNSIISNILSKR